MEGINKMNYVALISLFLGIGLCLFGFKMEKWAVLCAWFLLAFSIASFLLGKFINSEQIVIIISLTFGLVVGALGFKLEKLSLFIAMTYFSYIILQTYIKMDSYVLNIIVNLLGAMSCGLLAVFFIKPVMIFITSLYGGVLLLENIHQFVMLPIKALNIAVAMIVVMSIIFQFKTNK